MAQIKNEMILELREMFPNVRIKRWIRQVADPKDTGLRMPLRLVSKKKKKKGKKGGKKKKK
jgi:hypothetical protein